MKIKDEESYLLQVDREDKPISLIEKREAHVKGILHRAFSVFIFRKIKSSYELLLQQRACEKYHSGGLWSNTCCSHVTYDHIELMAKKRLKIEMGFDCPLFYVESFYYKADLSNGLVEHEIDHVFAAFHNPLNIHLNSEEVINYQWLEITTLQRLLIEKPHEFTVWFSRALEVALKFIPCVKKS